MRATTKCGSFWERLQKMGTVAGTVVGKKTLFFLELPANSRYLYSVIKEEQALSESTTSQHLRIKNNNTLPKPKKDGTRQ